MAEKPGVSMVEDRVRAPPQKRRHCRRFWWIYVMVFIVIIVIIIPVILLVAVPHIAQQKMNEAKLEVQGVNVVETTSNSYHMSINSTITTDGSVHGNIDPFEGELYLEDYLPHTPFATVNFPKTNSNSHQVVNISQEMKITDMEAFTRFNTWFHNNETTRVTIHGKTKIKPAGLSRKSKATFKKTVDFKGLNIFKGTKVTEGKISLEADKDGNNFKGRTTIPNASVYTLDIGNLTFTNFIDDTKVGELFIENFLLVPGDNNVAFSAKIDQATVLEKAQSKAYCKTGTVPFKLLGKSVINHGQSLSYFAKALGSSNQTVPIDIASFVKKDLGINIACA